MHSNRGRLERDNRYYLHYDQVGSLRAITDSRGNIVKEITYDSYGNIISDTNPNFKVPFGFAGGLYDPDTKLVHFGYREYDPVIGRWLSKDPLLFGGGDSNLYGYFLQDLVNLVDSSGEFALAAAAVVIELAAEAYLAYETTKALIKVGKAIYNWWEYEPHIWDVPATEDGGSGGACYASEHTKNKRPSTKGKHEKGQKRKKQKYNDKKRNKPTWRPRK